VRFLLLHVLCHDLACNILGLGALAALTCRCFNEPHEPRLTPSML
jgi:hypothetical protein